MAVKVRRERPDQRRHHRVTAPLFVGVGGHAVRAADWSLGGLKVEGFPGEVPAIGSEIGLDLTLPFQGFDVTFNVSAEVVRANATSGMFAVRFTVIGERERELMQHFIEELVRGSMSDVEDTIQRIDVPVTPASLEPDKPRIGKVPVRRLPIRTVAMSAVYICLGVMVFGYAAIIGYTNVYRMEVQTAVIAAPVETVAAQGDGRIQWTGLKPGDPIRAGDVLVNLIDNQIERELDLADLTIAERKARLVFMKQRHAEELERIRGYATVEMKNVQQTRVEIEALNAQLKLAEQNRQRLAQLHDKGFATDARLEEAEARVVSLKKEMDVRRIELSARVELAEQNLGKRLYSGNATVGSGEIAGKGAELEAEIRLAEHEIQFAQQRKIAILNQKDRAAVRAPFDGVIVELPRADQGSVRQGDAIAVVEQRAGRHIAAWLTQDEVLKVGLGDEALIFIPALNETLKGRVKVIDRTTGFVREQDQRKPPGYSWRGSTDRSAKITVMLEDESRLQDYQRYRSGIPVVVVFEQRSTNSLLSQIKKKLAVSL